MLNILWEHWKQRPARFFFTLLSLILSTATLVSIFVASHNARSSFRNLNEAVQGLPSLDLVSSSDERLEASDWDVATVLVEGEVNMPTLIRGTILRNQQNKSPGIVLGVPIQSAGPELLQLLTRELGLELSDLPGEDECIMSELVAKSLKLNENDSVQGQFRKGFRKLVVKRVISSKRWNQINGEHGLLVDLGWLQTMTKLRGKIDRNRIFLKDDSAATKLARTDELLSKIPDSMRVKERSNTVGVADDLLKSTELGLSFASALAVAMAAYIVLNSTRMNLAERRPHFAILRCLGATSKQIVGSVLLEAILVSCVGVLFGILAGFGLGSVMGKVLSSVLQTPPGNFTIPWISIVGIALFVPGLTVLVVWFAQKQQEAVSPLESFREPVVVENTGLPWKSIRNGTLLVWIALFGMFCVRQEWLSPQWGVIAGLLCLISFLLWIPLGLIPLIRIVNIFSGRRGGLPIEMAKQQLIRRPERTSLNAGFLVISLCGAVGLGQTLMSNTAEIQRWYLRAIPGDLFLISTQSPSLMVDSEDPLREIVSQLPGLKWSNAIRFVWCQIDQQSVLTLVREFPEGCPFPAEPRGMTTAQSLESLNGDHVFIGAMLAKKLAKKAGDMIPITLNGRTFSIEVGGVHSNFANGGMAMTIQRSTAQRFFPLTGFEWYSLGIDPKELSEVESKLAVVKEQYGFELQRGTDLRKGVEQAISGVTAGVWTTLAMNMIEQARDFSLLRIVGASRRQLMTAVLVQAWLLGLLGVAFGMLGGVNTVLIIYYCSEALLGYTPDFRWNPPLMIVSALGTLVIVTIAAIIPAWNASKINPVEHLTYE
jgi:putative ABC transport system permease protein